MSDANATRSTVSGTGTVTLRHRPSLLLMKVPLRAGEATLELGLTRLRRQCDETAQWLRRLGAARVTAGEPHFADQAEKDPVQAARAAAAAFSKRPAKAPADDRKRQVRAVVTAVWDIAAMPAEEVLALVDRLRFEAADTSKPAEEPDELPPWASPEEQMQQMMARLHQPPEEDTTPQFLFVARPPEEQLEKAYAEAFARARHSAERLARAAGMKLGRLSTLHYGHASLHRPEKMMERQRCLAILEGCSYAPGEDEVATDDPRPAEFAVAVNVSYHLE